MLRIGQAFRLCCHDATFRRQICVMIARLQGAHAQVVNGDCVLHMIQVQGRETH